MEDVLKRVAHLGSLDEEERACICLKLYEIGEDEAKRLVPDSSVLPDGVLAKMLRIKFLNSKVAPVGPEVAVLARNVPAFNFDGSEPTAAELTQYLQDFQFLKGFVPITRVPDVQATLQAPFVGSNSDLATLVAAAVYLKPGDGTGEPVSNYRAYEFCRILEHLRDHADQASQVAFLFSMDRAESSSSAQSSSQRPRLGKRKRPDFLFEFRQLVMMFAEGKAENSGFDIAVQEITEKVRRLPLFVYGEVRFLLAFVIAGYKLQLFVKRPAIRAPEPISKVYDLGQFDDRVELCLVFFKLYFLLLSMSKRMTIQTEMLPLFKLHHRVNSTIQLDAEGCFKTIKKFNQYMVESGVKYNDICKAYGLSRLDQLAYAIENPEVVRGVYEVRIGPLGSPAKEQIKSEDDCQRLASDILKALQLLHHNDLVHRDIRLDNVIFWHEKGCFVLIDLETVSVPNRRITKHLRDYEGSTLVDGKYTTTSDLHQLGALLEHINVSKSESFLSFIRRLKSHKTIRKRLGVTSRTVLAAEDVLQHPWIAVTNVPSL